MASTTSAITDPSRRWACRLRSYRAGTTCNSSPLSSRASRYSTTTPSSTELIIGPKANKPLRLEIPLFVSDMSFGALSAEAKVALATGAEMVGTGICSGEGGMLPEEQEANSRYFYELASARFGWDLDKAARCQAFHFKGGQGAKTGTGGHLPGHKVSAKIAEVRGLEPGQSAISPSTFPGSRRPPRISASVADQVREASGGIPIGFKFSAQHIEDDIDFALEVGVRVHHPRRPRRRHRSAAPESLQEEHLRADNPGAGASPPPPRGDARHHVDHHRWAAHRG